MRSLLALIVLTLGCTAELVGASPSPDRAGAGGSSQGPSSPAQVVIPQVTAAPGSVRPCSSENEVIAAVERFVAAFNSGSEGALRAAISPLAQWYSVTLPGSHEVAYGQADMIRHVGMRHAAGDRLERPRIAVNALVGWDGGAHFGVTSIELRRGNATFELHGKGALYCDGSGRGINVISLGA